MKGDELLRKLKKIAKERKETIELINAHGKGSHATLKMGNRRTILKDRKKEIGEGLLASILKDLGLTKDDLK